MEPLITTDPAHVTPRTAGPAMEIAPRLFMHPVFVNTYALKTSDGLVLIDPGLGHLTNIVKDAVREWEPIAPVKSAIYTHGHADHAFGLGAFIDAGDTPRIYAQENLPARFDRYKMTHGWNARINQRQFGLPEPFFVTSFLYPTDVFRSTLDFTQGDTSISLVAAKGETDDHCYVWVPKHRYLFTGDLIIWQSPNCGNPQKVQRYPREWAEALEEMAKLKPLYLFPGHGLAVKGEEAVQEILLNTAKYLRHIVDAVLSMMNEGHRPDDIFHAIEPHPELSRLPYLGAGYDHPKFIVRNLLRLYGGWWGGNPAYLLPRKENDIGKELISLTGGTPDRIVSRGRQLLAAAERKNGSAAVADLRLAAHLAEWAASAQPQHRPSLLLKRDVFTALFDQEPSLMARGIYREAANDARKVLGDDPMANNNGPMSLAGNNEPKSRL